MATQSTIVTDDVIQKFKDSVAQWKLLRVEVQMATEAGLQTPVSLKQIDENIANTVKIIETYTGLPYRP
jgi:hypothetical protein